MSNPQLYKHKPVSITQTLIIYSFGTNEETTMFSSILLGALMACNQPATAPEYVPGVLETDGKLIATVNGVQIKDGIVDSLLKDAPKHNEQRSWLDHSHLTQRATGDHWKYSIKKR